ncbi:MAG: YggS family pyridoxal phosphate-dependent enzyme [Candidatus Omnitrophica bacterium]|nr:YggS family pyridoxal phosphate-dependent enzyme [Candidatus Omnitrophota bacterium]
MVKDNIAKVFKRINSASARANIDPLGVRIIAVSKGRQVKDIEDALACGLNEIGENRVQEAFFKFNQLTTGKQANRQIIKWHMIGRLQRNKVKDAVKIFDLIHSVDSLRLAYEIDSQAEKIGKVQDILMEVKTSPEATKSGFLPGEISEAIDKISGLKNIGLKGLMTIPPLSGVPEDVRPYFSLLRSLRDKFDKSFFLSMGMTDDFEIAIEEGANMVRLGRAIFDS